MTDLLGRKLATVTRRAQRFVIECDERSRLEGALRGPHDTLDLAFGEIEKRTVGRCRREAR